MKDILIPVKEGEPNEQLRYALRSLKNIPHGKVYIAGYKPSWVTNVEYIPVNRRYGSRFDKAAYNIFMACKSDISQEFYLFSDDFYITKSIQEIPNYYRGSIDDVLELYGEAKSQYLSIMRSTKNRLQQNNLSTKSFELHCPMTIDKTKFIQTCDFMLYKHIPHGSTRSVYGNLHKVKATLMKNDVKVYDPLDKLPQPFFSTNHRVWPKIQPMLQDMFPYMSLYEHDKRQASRRAA